MVDKNIIIILYFKNTAYLYDGHKIYFNNLLPLCNETFQLDFKFKLN